MDELSNIKKFYSNLEFRELIGIQTTHFHSKTILFTEPKLLPISKLTLGDLIWTLDYFD